MLVGASGYIGKATVAALVGKVGGQRIVVATRKVDSDAAGQYKALGASVVFGDLNMPHQLETEFFGASAVYIIAPGSEVRL